MKNMLSKSLLLAAFLTVATSLSAGTPVGATAGDGGGVTPVYMACTLETHHSGGTCPGPNPTNPGACYYKTWTGAGCEAVTTSSTCTPVLTLGSTTITEGHCVNGACVLDGASYPLETAIDSCSAGGSTTGSTTGTSTTGTATTTTLPTTA